MRVKIVVGTDYADLQNQLNEYLSGVDRTPVKVQYELDKMIAIVEHDEVKVICRCCDCQSYDPSEDNRGAWGLCHRKGIRTRFNSKKCELFIDIRKKEENE